MKVLILVIALCGVVAIGFAASKTVRDTVTQIILPTEEMAQAGGDKSVGAREAGREKGDNRPHGQHDEGNSHSHDGSEEKSGKDDEKSHGGEGHDHNDGDGHGNDDEGARHGRGAESSGGKEGHVRMPSERVQASGIATVQIGKGGLTRRISAPGTVVVNSDRVARVPAKVVGTVVEMHKRLGDKVEVNEIVAVLESREVADANSEYLTASVHLDLQKTAFDRSQILWDKRITSEQLYLQARATFREARLRFELARQKLLSLNLEEKEVAAIVAEDGKAANSNLRRYVIRSPGAGRVIERKVDVGAAVGQDGDPKELYTVADLSTVWVELAASTTELPSLSEGQTISIEGGGSDGRRSDGRIVFISPVLDKETRSARVIAEIDNKDMSWRPGTFVTAEIAIAEDSVALQVPRDAVQSVEGAQVVFVQNESGFEKREVVLGRGDARAVEIVSGLRAGDTVAVKNTFLLKAELGKAEAEHSH